MIYIKSDNSETNMSSRTVVPKRKDFNGYQQFQQAQSLFIFNLKVTNFDDFPISAEVRFLGLATEIVRKSQLIWRNYSLNDDSSRFENKKMIIMKK